MDGIIGCIMSCARLIGDVKYRARVRLSMKIKVPAHEGGARFWEIVKLR